MNTFHGLLNLLGRAGDIFNDLQVAFCKSECNEWKKAACERQSSLSPLNACHSSVGQQHVTVTLSVPPISSTPLAFSTQLLRSKRELSAKHKHSRCGLGKSPIRSAQLLKPDNASMCWPVQSGCGESKKFPEKKFLRGKMRGKLTVSRARPGARASVGIACAHAPALRRRRAAHAPCRAQSSPLPRRKTQQVQSQAITCRCRARLKYKKTVSRDTRFSGHLDSF